MLCGQAPKLIGLTPKMGVATPTRCRSTPSLGVTTPGLGVSTPSMGVATPGLGVSTPGLGVSTPDPGLSTPGPGVSTPTLCRSTPGPGVSTPVLCRLDARPGSPQTPVLGRSDARPGSLDAHVGSLNAQPGSGDAHVGSLNAQARQLDAQAGSATTPGPGVSTLRRWGASTPGPGVSTRPRWAARRPARESQRPCCAARRPARSLNARVLCRSTPGPGVSTPVLCRSTPGPGVATPTLWSSSAPKLVSWTPRPGVTTPRLSASTPKLVSWTPRPGMTTPRLSASTPKFVGSTPMPVEWRRPACPPRRPGSSAQLPGREWRRPRCLARPPKVAGSTSKRSWTPRWPLLDAPTSGRHLQSIVNHGVSRGTAAREPSEVHHSRRYSAMAPRWDTRGPARLGALLASAASARADGDPAPAASGVRINHCIDDESRARAARVAEASQERQRLPPVGHLAAALLPDRCRAPRTRGPAFVLPRSPTSTPTPRPARWSRWCSRSARRRATRWSCPSTSYRHDADGTAGFISSTHFFRRDRLREADVLFPFFWSIRSRDAENAPFKRAARAHLRPLRLVGQQRHR